MSSLLTDLTDTSDTIHDTLIDGLKLWLVHGCKLAIHLLSPGLKLQNASALRPRLFVQNVGDNIIRSDFLPSGILL